MKRYSTREQNMSTFVRILVIFSLLFFFYQVANAKPIRVAVIDTGLNQSLLKHPIRLCTTGHKDFTSDNNPFLDENGHGTNISGVINAYAKRVDYCQVILKYYSYGTDSHLTTTIKAFQYAIKLKVDIINYSSSGNAPDDAEKFFIKLALNKGIKVVTAVGNDYNPIEIYPTYPACYDKRIIAVAALNKKGDRYIASNFSDTVYKNISKCNNTAQEEIGRNLGVIFKDGSTLIMSGSSQAAALRSGKEVVRSYYAKLKSK